MLLNKYAFAAVLLTVSVNWEAGSVIEAGDSCVINDSQGVLQISNFTTGTRGLGQQLFQVINRSFDFKAGRVQLTLQGNSGSAVNDRFATISPSSNTDVGSTTTQLIIKDSFGALYPGDESQKWSNYVGLPILVHSQDYSVQESTVLTGVSETNNYILTVSPPLSSPPPADYIIDIADYPAYPNTNTATNAFYKLMHVFISPTVLVATGIDQRNFTVASGDAYKFLKGAIVQVHSENYSLDSGEVIVTLVSGTQITVNAALDFVPTVGMQIDFIGFADGGQSYRLA